MAYETKKKKSLVLPFIRIKVAGEVLIVETEFRRDERIMFSNCKS
jgi:hypothetical protein